VIAIRKFSSLDSFAKKTTYRYINFSSLKIISELRDMLMKCDDDTFICVNRMHKYNLFKISE